MSADARTVQVAAVQMQSDNGEVGANLARALRYVEEAVERGAEVIALPEFMPTGYAFTTAIWDAAEPTNGPTVQWLKKHSARLGVYLGTSFLEADGEDFFNTFVLTTPLGQEAGRVRKQTPCAFEAYFTRGAPGSHVMDTALGRIGVGICYENALAFTPHLMHSQRVDLLLMPHSAPTPTQSRFFPRWAVDAFEEVLRSHAQRYASLLGVPTVLVNKCGPWKTSILGLPFTSQDSSFPGLSAIADSDGRVRAQLGEEAGVLVEEVTLDPSRKKSPPPARRGHWSVDVPWAANATRVIEAAGAAWYRFSRERRRRAREISSRA